MKEDRRRVEPKVMGIEASLRSLHYAVGKLFSQRATHRRVSECLCNSIREMLSGCLCVLVSSAARMCWITLYSSAAYHYSGSWRFSLPSVLRDKYLGDLCHLPIPLIPPTNTIPSPRK